MMLANRGKHLRIFSSYRFVSCSARYGFAVLATALATLLELGLRALGPWHETFLPFYPAVVVVAMYAGFGPGILASSLGGAVAGFFFLEPRNSFAVHTPEDIVGPVLFVIIGIALTVLTCSRERSQRAMRESEDRYRDLVEHSEDLVCTHDLQGRLLSVNPAPARILGYEVEELLKIPMRELIAPEFRNEFDEYLTRVGTKGADRGLMCVLTKSGERRIWEYSNTLRTDGVVSPVVRGMAHDVSERRRAEEALQQSEERLWLAQGVAHIGTFDRNLVTGESRWTPQMEAMYGLKPGTFPRTIEQFLELVHPEDRDRVSELVRASVESGEAQGEWRVQWPDGSLHWITGRWRVFKDKTGTPMRAIGIDYDITARKRAYALAGLQNEVLDLIARGRSLEESLTTMVRRIESECSGMLGSVLLLDEDGVHVRHGAAPNLPGAYVKAIDGAAIGPKAGSCGTAMYRKEAVIVRDVMQDPLWEDYRGLASAHGLRACWSTPILSSEGRVLGSFAMYYTEPCDPRPAELQLIEVATHLAGVAIERKQVEELLRRSEERFRVALTDSPVTVFNQDRDLRFTWVYNPPAGWPSDVVGKTCDQVLGAKSAARLNELERRVLETGKVLREELAIVQNGSRRAYDVTLEPLLDSAGTVVGITGSLMDVERLRELADRLEEQRDKLTQEKSYLEAEIQTELGFEEIIGQSPALREVLKKARIVAPIDSTVLLLGESGTGKELVARAVHALGSRKDNTFVKLNCAAVPSGLLESELFGHEKGAFTGAVSQKIGRMELADKGTLFLDEVGELPLELQPKLLRVLQDREFERLGGVRTLKVDVRIIAATNRDLQEDVATKRFREDLFYRLNVFPIELPALRDRRSDIPQLVMHFVSKHAKRMGKRIKIVPNETMDILQSWQWPGNVRELENMIERMVILTKGDELAPPPEEIWGPYQAPDDHLIEMEKEHIIRVLRETNGVLAGPEGAANRLGMKRTTLQSMLKRLGIDPGDFRRGTGTYGE